MASIQILLGRSRWRRRAVLPRALLSGTDPFGRPTALTLTTTVEKRRAIEREFVSFRRDAPAFAPRVQVLDALLTELWARHGDGRAILSATAEAILAERVLARDPSAWPWLARLARGRRDHPGDAPAAWSSIGRALAGLRAELDGARATVPDDVPHATELRAALHALRSALAARPRHLTREQALEGLIPLLTSPTPALFQTLQDPHSVLIDDVIDPSPLERAVLITLCRAWAAAGTHVVLSLETGRDLGGREVGVLFEYDDVDPVAFALRPFLATRALRRTLFEEFIASGEAELVLARRDGVVVVDPGEPLLQPGEPDLSDLLYTGGELPASDPEQGRALLRDTVTITRHPDPDSELRSVARAVKRLLLDGTAPEDCVIAVPDPADIADRLSHVLADHGVPLRMSRGPALAARPIAGVVRNILTLALDDYPADRVLGLVRSDLVASGDLSVADVERLAVAVPASGILAGRPASWGPELERWARRTTSLRARLGLSHPGPALVRAAKDLEAWLAPLDALSPDATPAAFLDALMGTLEALGLPDQLEDIPEDSEELAGWGDVLQVLEARVIDLVAADEGVWPAAELARSLDDALAEATRRPPRQEGGAVQVLPIDDLLGLTPRHLWVLGLDRTSWPRPAPPDFLIPRTVRRRWQPADPIARGRYLFTSVLRNSLDDREMEGLHLSWPATIDGRPAPPTPFLADLLDLPTNAAPRPTLLGTLILDEAPPPPAHPPLAASDRLRLAALNPDWRDTLSAPERALAEAQTAVHAARRQREPGAWEGLLVRPPREAPAEIAVTALEDYLQCPARYWYRRVLDLSPVEPWDPDLAAWKRGQVIHQILETFMAERLGHPLDGDPDALSRELYDLAIDALARLSREGSAMAALIDHHETEWLSGLVDDQPRGILAAWLAHELAEGPTPVQTERTYRIDLGPLVLKAKVDRVDRLADASDGDGDGDGQVRVVLDYKTGSPPSTRRVHDGLVLQPVAYAHAVAEDTDGARVIAGYTKVGKADDVRRTGWVGPKDLRRRVAGRRARGLDLDDEGRDARMQHARDAARRLTEGRFHTTLADPKHVHCDRCDFRHVCRLDPARAMALAAGDHDLQAPFAPDPEEAP